MREAQWVKTPTDADNELSFYKVGRPTHFIHRVVVPTRIVVQDDVPGLHCNLWRVCVYEHEELISEFPYHNVEEIGYV